MSDGVLIPYEVLNELNGSLKQIIVEFEKAGSRSNDLEQAIATPYGRSSLRDEADRFEGDWDDKRETLKQDIEEIQKHVEEVGTAWSNWDTEASASLSVDRNETKNLPKEN
ncbi:MAG: flagellar protein FlgN [Agromyces sp.]|nr:flagellar protein FlgN [Agromyces sp.]